MKRTSKFGIVALCLTAVMASCGPSMEELETEQARVAELQGQLTDAERQRQEMEARLSDIGTRNQDMAARLAALGEDVTQLRVERSGLQQSLEETRRALEELRARERQAQARLATFQGLIERFRSMIESGRLRVRIVRNRMVVELPEGVLFDSARAELKDGGKSTLSEVAQVLREIPDRQFQIAGHTDNLPIRNRFFRNNWDLSVARAVNVATFMIDTGGVPADRISAAGYADTQPVASNDTAETRAQNRRIEIVLVPNLNELPDLSALENSAQ